jgi:hypothetical protein
VLSRHLKRHFKRYGPDVTPSERAHNPEVAGSNPAPATRKARLCGPSSCARIKKVGVRSRRELFAHIFLQHYVARLHAGAQVGATGWFASAL